MQHNYNEIVKSAIMDGGIEYKYPTYAYSSPVVSESFNGYLGFFFTVDGVRYKFINKHYTFRQFEWNERLCLVNEMKKLHRSGELIDFVRITLL